MKILVTGSAGHLSEALIRSLRSDGNDPIGLDIKESPYTTHVGSIDDLKFVRNCMAGVDVVLHTATLHKPHVATHSRQDFIDTNITGTLNLLEASVGSGVQAFIYTSTTSTFGDAMRPARGEPAVWVTEDLQTKPRNIYGVTKSAAEDLCQLFNRNQELPCIILRTSRFFPEMDDDSGNRDSYSDENLKVNELLYRRADIQDVVEAHKLSIVKAQEISFDKFIISATTPFQRSDAAQLGLNVSSVLERYVPKYKDEYARRGWKMLPTISRVYDNRRAREKLGWTPAFNFHQVVDQLVNDEDYRSKLAQEVGSKGYHNKVFTEGPYPVD